jgi:hypothetical protein
MGYHYIHFFNIEYWYCVIVSLFGAKCTDATLSSVGLPSGGAGGISGTTVPVQAPGFWEWLFGLGSGAGAASSAGTAAGPTGFFGTLFFGIAAFVGALWALFSLFAYLLSFLLFLLIVFSLAGLFFIRIEEQARYGNLAPATNRTHPLRARWQTLIEYSMSSDPKRWKEALGGADELLGELFARLGYEGATTSERIRRVPEGAFANLPAAWEAHRIKNFVFAPSSHFILTQREAFRVMKLYERVFREFDFI